MIRVPRGALDSDADWITWWEGAEAAINALIDAYQRGDDVSIDSQLYQAAKPFLLKAFNDKCAYCETVISAAQPGDVEHYRPKGRIRTRAGIVRIVLQGREVDHPGYWWLAYNWSNLLPSCTDCNRRRQHEDVGMAGKADYFEIRGERAKGPLDSLDAEQALLLDPSKPEFEPETHFRFNADGTVDPLTDDAKYSCELLGLNLREKLVAQRREAYVNAQLTLMAFVNTATVVALNNLPKDSLTNTASAVNDMWGGRAQVLGVYPCRARSISAQTPRTDSGSSAAMTTDQQAEAAVSRNLVICLDGTDNQFGRHNTNVVRVFQSLARDPLRQIGYYDPGVGTIWESGTLSKMSQKVQMLLGMAFGLGVSQNVAQAYAFLMRHYQAGDRTFIFGFSRGALEARALAGLVHRCGLLEPQLVSLDDYAYRLFKSPGNERVLADFKRTFSRQIEVDFLGLWDTVTAMGNVWSPIYWPFTTRNPSVKRLVHAIAIDERRSFFRQNRWTAVANQQVSEMWFAGVHSDIGGGYPTSSGRLWAITLEWMMDHAQTPLHPGGAALIVDPVRYREIKAAGQIDTAAPDHASNQHNSLTWGWTALELLPKPYRDEQADGSYKTRVMLPVLHGGLRGRPRKLRPGEHVHRSAIERFVARNDYRPPTLCDAGLTIQRAHVFLASDAASWIVPALPL